MPAAGTIGLSRIKGFMGFLISLGQWANGDGWSPTHAFILLDEYDSGLVFAAFPGGAGYMTLANEERMRGPVEYLDIPLTDTQRVDVLRGPDRYLGTPYSFVEYLALAAMRLKVPSKRLRAYVASSNRMICSQLCDQIYRDAGVFLFKDGRLPQDVTPGDLGSLPRLAS